MMFGNTKDQVHIIASSFVRNERVTDVPDDILALIVDFTYFQR